jgi:O-antigen ligase
MGREPAFAFRREPAIIGSLFFLASFVTLIEPLTAVPVLVVLFAASIAIAVLHGGNARELFRIDAGLALFAAVALYLLVNASWSLDPSRALSKVLWFGLVAVMAFGAARSVSNWSERQTRLAVLAFLAGVGAGLAIVLVQLATGQGLTRFLYNWFPGTRPASLKTITVSDGQVVSIALSELNRSVAVMLLMLWPALLCLSRAVDARRRSIGMAALPLAATAAIFLSTHETSQIGLVVSAVVFAAAWFWPVLTRRGVFAGWCLAFVLVVPLATLAFQERLHESELLPYSAKARIVLWADTAQKIPDAPVLGIGLTSTRKLNAEKRLEPHREVLADVAKPQRYFVRGANASLHSHNVFLQTWYELGAVGVILLLLAGGVVISYIARLPKSVQPFILAQFAAFFVIAAFSWGMWQSWLMASAGLAAVYAALSARFASLPAPIAAKADRKFGRAPKAALAPGERPA